MPTPINQLLSRTLYATDGSTTEWDFSFSGGYISKSHVKAYIEAPSGERTELVVTEDMLTGPFTLRLSPALPFGDTLTIYRDTPKDLPLVDFTDESGFSEVSLDTNAKQAVFIAAETTDTVNTSTTYDAEQAAIQAASAASNAEASANAASLAALSAANSANSSLVSANASLAASEAAAGEVANFASSLADTAGSTLVGDNDGAGGSLWTTVRGFIARLLGSGGAALVGYLPAGTGAVATTVQSKLRESVSVRDFGATGAGDVAAIHAAMTHAIADNKVIEFDFSATIRIPTDVATLQQAIDHIKTTQQAVKITLQIDAGHTLTSGTHVDADNMRNFNITAVDAIVPCTLPATDPEGILFGVTHGGYHPFICAVFDLQHTGLIGVYARRSGKADVAPGCGVINSGVDGAYAYRGGVINASRKHTTPGTDAACVFYGAANYCARARRGGIFNGTAANLTNAGNAAVQLNYGGIAHISAANLSGAVGLHILCQAGSLCHAGNISFDGALRTNIIPNVANNNGLILSSDAVSRGNWTPSIIGTTVEGANTYVVRVGRWVIQNGLLHVWARIGLSNLASVGALRVTGFPFSVGGGMDNGAVHPCNVTLNAGGNLPAGEKLALRFINTTEFTLRREGNVASSALLNTLVTNTFDMAFYACYELDMPDGITQWNA